MWCNCIRSCNITQAHLTKVIKPQVYVSPRNEYWVNTNHSTILFALNPLPTNRNCVHRVKRTVSGIRYLKDVGETAQIRRAVAKLRTKERSGKTTHEITLFCNFNLYYNTLATARRDNITVRTSGSVQLNAMKTTKKRLKVQAEKGAAAIKMQQRSVQKQE